MEVGVDESNRDRRRQSPFATLAALHPESSPPGRLFVSVKDNDVVRDDK